MTKILLTNLNSAWGVITNPQSSNTYREIISFDTLQQKDEFINTELFNSTSQNPKDYKQLITQQPNVAFVEMSSTAAEFIVNPKDYPNENFYSLLNKDFAIVYQDGEYRFYTLQGKRNGGGNTILFSADLDIFFTYDIKNMFNDKPVRIVRSHFDRIRIEPKFPIIFYQNTDDKLSTPYYSTEPFPDITKEILIPKSNQILHGRVNIRFPDPTDSKFTKFTPEQIAALSSAVPIILATKLPLLYRISTVKPDYSNFYFFDRNAPDEYQKSVYSIWIEQTLRGYFDVDNKFNFPEPIIGQPQLPKSTIPYKLIQKINGRTIKKPEEHDPNLALENARTIKQGGYSLLPFSWIELFTETTSWEVRYNNRSGQIEINVADGAELTKGIIGEFDSSNNPNSIILSAKHPIKKKLEDLAIDLSNTGVITDLGLEKPIRHDLGKIRNSQFTKYFIESTTTLSKQIFQENLLDTDVIFRSNLSPENYHYSIEPTNYFKNYNSEIYSKNKSVFEFSANYAFPTAKEPYEEFIARNKASLNNSYLTKGLQAGAGVLGAAAGIATKGPLAAVALGSVALKAATDISQTIAQQKDIKNSPNTYISNGTALGSDMADEKIFNPMLVKYEIPHHIKNSIQDFLYMYGFNFEKKLFNINTLLKTRYYFNHIEAPSTFENIKLNLSAEIKQLINDTLENGVNIWHYRDEKTWKGVKNYSYDNLEMEIFKYLP